MAETKDKSTPMYNYKGNDIDKELLRKNLNNNVANYLASKNWTDSKKQEFRDAYREYMEAFDNDRLTTDEFSALVDNQGVLNNGSANYRNSKDNVLSQKEYDSLKRRKKKGYTNDFYPHREVATYFDAVAGGLMHALDDEKAKNGKKKSDSNANGFDFSNNGLWSNFMRYLSPSGNIDLETYWNSDKLEDGTYGTGKRASLLSDFITNDYKNRVSEDWDFGNFTDRDTYLKRLDTLVDALKNGVSDEDFLLLNQLGANPNDYRNFFSTTGKQYRQQTPEEQVAEEEAAGKEAEQKQAEEEESAIDEAINNLGRQQRDNFNNRKYRQYTLGNREVRKIEIDPNASTPEDKYTSYMNNLNALTFDSGANSSLAGKSVVHLFDLDTLQNENTLGANYSPYIAQYAQYNPSEFRDASQYGNYAGWKYMPNSYNVKTGSVLAFNPSNNAVQRIFLTDLGEEAARNHKSYLINQYRASQYTPGFQTGGAVPTISQEALDRYFAKHEDEIQNALADYNESVNANLQFQQDRVEQSEKTRANQKLRQPWEEANAYSENKFTTTDKVRLAALATDIAAIIDWDPTSSAVLGAASSIANYGADLHEGYGFWNSTGRFAANLGLSAFNMIPIIGGAAGGGGKVVKTLSKMAPKIGTALFASGVIATLSNGDEIIHSLRKIGKPGVENELNMEDWRNIGMAVQLVLGGTNAASTSRAMKTIRKGTVDKGSMVVSVRDKNTGETKNLKFTDANDVKALKKANDDKSIEGVNKVINGHASYKDYEFDAGTKNTSTWFGEKSKWYKPWSWRSRGTEDAFNPYGIRQGVDEAKLAQMGKGPWYSRRAYMARHADRYGLGVPHYDEEVIGGANTAPKPAPKPNNAFNNNRASYEAMMQGLEVKYGGKKIPHSDFINKINAEKNPGKKKALEAEFMRYKNFEVYNAHVQHAKNSVVNGRLKVLQDINKKLTGNGKGRELAHAKLYADEIGKLQPSQISKFSNDVLKEQSNLYYNFLTKDRQFMSNGIPQVPHSASAVAYAQKIGANPQTDADWLKLKIWRQGGSLQRARKAAKKQQGGSVNLLDSDFVFDPETQQYKVNPQGVAGASYRKKKNYGLNYKGLEAYGDNEYRSSNPVDISGIKDANAALRNTGVLVSRDWGNEQPDYNDARIGTKAKRTAWQTKDDGKFRYVDFMNWARNWYNDPNNTDKSQDKMLADYNNTIDSMYEFKKNMADNHAGKDSYWTNESVGNFNRNNKAVYATANNPNNRQKFLGYDENVENTNGTATAHRFIDITDTDVPMNGFDSHFTDSDGDDFKKLFSNLTKDSTGRYYVESPQFELVAGQAPEVPTSNTEPNGTVDQRTEVTKGDTETPEKTSILDRIRKVNLTGDMVDTAGTIAAARLNNNLYNVAKQMPIYQYNPSGMYRWLTGDNRAIQEGYLNRGQLMHAANQPITADAAQQQAMMLSANQQGNAYVNAGYKTNDVAANAAREQNFAQEKENMQSRYTVAEKNRENLYEGRANRLNSLASKYRADFENLWGTNGLFGRMSANLKQKEQERKALINNMQESSIKNDIINNPGKYGLSISDSDAAFLRQVASGKLDTSGSTEDTNRYYELASLVNDAYYKYYAAQHGYDYNTLDRAAGGVGPSVLNFATKDARGGSIDGDTEKVTIQKLKNRAKRMKARQKELELRINAYEKDLDRAQKGAANYSQAQKRKAK